MAATARPQRRCWTDDLPEYADGYESDYESLPFDWIQVGDADAPSDPDPRCHRFLSEDAGSVSTMSSNSTLTSSSEYTYESESESDDDESEYSRYSSSSCSSYAISLDIPSDDMLEALSVPELPESPKFCAIADPSLAPRPTDYDDKYDELELVVPRENLFRDPREIEELLLRVVSDEEVDDDGPARKKPHDRRPHQKPVQKQAEQNKPKELESKPNKKLRQQKDDEQKKRQKEARRKEKKARKDEERRHRRRQKQRKQSKTRDDAPRKSTRRASMCTDRARVPKQQTQTPQAQEADPARRRRRQNEPAKTQNATAAEASPNHEFSCVEHQVPKHRRCRKCQRRPSDGSQVVEPTGGTEHRRVDAAKRAATSVIHVNNAETYVSPEAPVMVPTHKDILAGDNNGKQAPVLVPIKKEDQVAAPSTVASSTETSTPKQPEQPKKQRSFRRSGRKLLRTISANSKKKSASAIQRLLRSASFGSKSNRKPSKRKPSKKIFGKKNKSDAVVAYENMAPKRQRVFLYCVTVVQATTRGYLCRKRLAEQKLKAEAEAKQAEEQKLKAEAEAAQRSADLVEQKPKRRPSPRKNRRMLSSRKLEEPSTSSRNLREKSSRNLKEKSSRNLKEKSSRNLMEKSSEQPGPRRVNSLPIKPKMKIPKPTVYDDRDESMFSPLQRAKPSFKGRQGLVDNCSVDGMSSIDGSDLEDDNEPAPPRRAASVNARYQSEDEDVDIKSVDTSDMWSIDSGLRRAKAIRDQQRQQEDTLSALIVSPWKRPKPKATLTRSNSESRIRQQQPRRRSNQQHSLRKIDSIANRSNSQQQSIRRINSIGSRSNGQPKQLSSKALNPLLLPQPLPSAHRRRHSNNPRRTSPTSVYSNDIILENGDYLEVDDNASGKFRSTDSIDSMADFEFAHPRRGRIFSA